jgi:hypothetical protein
VSEIDGRESAVPVIPARRVRAGKRRVTVPVPEDQEVVQEPAVELIRDEDGVRAIDLTCACGRRHRILCDYEEGPPS